MADIVTITLNPTVDLSTATDHVVAGPKLRCSAPIAEPGGGGINVSRAIKFLGGHSKAFIATGGETGMQLLKLLVTEGIDFEAFTVEGETRQSIAVTDKETREQFRFVMPGPTWTEDMVERVIRDISQAAPAQSIVVLSGSQPPGVPSDLTARLSAALLQHDLRLVVDTSGAPLAHLVAQPADLFALRMDDAEAQGLAGRPLTTRKETAAFASGLVARGVARSVVIARGSDGSTLAHGPSNWHCACKVPADQIRSAVGAGDSFVGAMALEISRSADLEKALRFGTAAAAAAVMTEGTRLCQAEDVQALLSRCEFTTL